MGFYFIRDIINYVIVDKSPEDPVEVAANIKTFEKQFELAKTNALGNNYYTLDLLVTKMLNAVALINVNYAQVKIQGNPTSDFSTIAFDSGILNITTDPLRRRYNLLYIPQGFNYRFIRIYIPSQTPVDGASKFSTGGVVVTDLAKQFYDDPSYGITFSEDKNDELNEFQGGGYEVITYGERGVEISFDVLVSRTEPNSYKDLVDTLVTIDRDVPILIAPNDTASEFTDTSPLVYVVSRYQRKVNYRWDSYLQAQLSPLVFREMI